MKENVPKNQSKTYCFIDGTCRAGKLVFKSNGAAQWTFECAMGLVIAAWIPWLGFLYGFLIKRSLVRFHFSPDEPDTTGESNPPHGWMLTNSVCMFLNIYFAWIMMVSGAVLFAVGMVKELGLDGEFELF